MAFLFQLSVVVLVLSVGLKLLLESSLVAPTLEDPSLSVLCSSTVRHPYNQGNVSDFPGECFFADSYEEAREQFIAFAKQCDAELFSLPIDENAHLTTDVAVIRRSREKLIIHVSGTHGVEGYAGSAVQATALHHLSLQPLETRNNEMEPTLIFVHILNPYGMKNNRRVNENNIDLNRNFLTPSQLELALTRDPNFANYVDAMDTLSPSNIPFPFAINILNDIRYSFLLGKILINGMMSKMKKALLSGNYHFQQGLGYGGQERSMSYKNLDNFLRSQGLGLFDGITADSTKLKKVVLIDVHTGLGPSGVDTLSQDGVGFSKLSHETVDYFEQRFPLELQGSDIIGGIKSTSADGRNVFDGYDLMMGDVDGYCRFQLTSWMGEMAWRNRVCTTQEFGTYSSRVVGNALVSENHMFHYGSPEQREFYGQKLKRVFYVRNKKWTRAVVHRGMEVLLQAADFANEE